MLWADGIGWSGGFTIPKKAGRIHKHRVVHPRRLGDLDSFRFLDRQIDNRQVDHLHAIGGLGRLKSLKVLNICTQAQSMTVPFTVRATEAVDSIKSLARFDMIGASGISQTL